VTPRPLLIKATNLIKADFDLLDTWRLLEQDKPPQAIYRDHRYQPPGANLPRKEWVTLNCLWTGVGRFNFNMFHLGLNDSPDCVGGKLQTAQHINNHCAVLR